MAPVPTEVKYEESTGESKSEASSQADIPESGTRNLHNADTPSKRKKCIVVGLGMVGIAFIEKLLKYDIDGGRDEWEVVV